MAEKQKSNLTESDIEQLRSVIRSLMKSDGSNTKEFLNAVKSGLDTQSKNFASVLKSMQHGFVDFKSSGSSLEKIFKDISLLNNTNAKDIIRILNKNKALKSGSDVQELEKLLLKDVIQNNKIQVELDNDDDYIKITKLITATQKQADLLNTDLDSVTQHLTDNADIIDDTLGNLALFHKQLEKLSAEYKKQGIYQDIIGVNINASKDSIDDLIITASKYTDMLSVMDIPAMSADDAISEFNKLKSNLNSDSIDLAGEVGLNFNDAATLMSNRFNTELSTIEDRVMDIKDNILAGIMAIGGFSMQPDSSGNTSMTSNGLPVTPETQDAILANSQRMQDMYNLMAEHNAMIIRDGKDQIKLEQSKIKFANDLIASHIEMGVLTDNLLLTDKDRLDYLNDHVHAAEAEIKTLSEKEQLLFHIHSSAMATLAMQNKQIKLSKAELDVMTKYRSTIQSVEGTQSYLIDQVEDMMFKLPLWSRGMLGTDKILDTIKISSDKAFNSMTEKLFNKENPSSFFDAISGYVKDFTGGLLGTISPIKLMAAGFALAAVAVYNIMGRVKDISTELGVSKGEAFKLYDAMLKMEGAAGNIAVTQERIMQIQTAHLEKYGRLVDLTSKEGKELVEYSSLMSSAYGIAADEAASMIELFKQIGADDGLANNLAASTLKAAELAKISPKIIAKDLIDGAEEISMYFGNMPEQAALAAINIRRMGSNIKKVGEQMQSTWNIENFMTDMYEVAQLTGSEINLSGVFDAGINGDAEAFQESLLSALGSLDELNNYSPQAQKKIAESIGMTVGEMKNMLKMSEMNLSLTEAEQSALNSQLDTMGDITGMSKDDLESKAKSYAATEAMDMAWTRITATLTRSFLPIVEVISDILVALGPVIDIIGLGFKLIGLAIKPFIPALKSISWLIGLASTKLSEGMQILDGWITKGENIGDGMGEWVKIGGSFLLLGGLIISQWSKIGSLLDKLKGGFGSIFNAGNVKDKIKEKIIGQAGSVTDKIKETVTNSASDTTKSTVIDKIKEQKDKLIEKYTSKTETASGNTKSMSERIKSGMESLKDITGGLADAIIEPIKKIGSGIGDVFKSILGGIADGLNKFTPKAAIGAASLLIISGALWVTSKALQEFNSVEWESVAKGLISLTGLAGIAMLLGTAAPQMLIGSAAMAILGLAMIPLAYALNMFNNVKWDSLGKGAAALVGFGVVAAGMGAILPLILSGSIAITALGASLTVFGAGLTVAAFGIGQLSEVTDGIINSITRLKDINPTQLIGIATGLGAISMAFTAFTGMGAVGSMMTLLTGDPITKLTQLASAAPGIALLASSFTALVAAIKEFNATSVEMDDTKLNKLSTISSTSEPDIPNVSNLSSQLVSDKEYSKTETNYNNTTNMGQSSTSNKTEQLLAQLVAIMSEVANNPIPAVVGNDQIPALAKKVKAFNNR